LNISFIQKQN